MLKNSVEFSNYLSNHWTNISSIKQIDCQRKIFGIRSLFIPLCLISHQTVGTKMNTAATYLVPAPIRVFLLTGINLITYPRGVQRGLYRSREEQNHEKCNAKTLFFIWIFPRWDLMLHFHLKRDPKNFLPQRKYFSRRRKMDDHFSEWQKGKSISRDNLIFFTLLLLKHLC